MFNDQTMQCDEKFRSHAFFELRLSSNNIFSIHDLFMPSVKQVPICSMFKAWVVSSALALSYFVFLRRQFFIRVFLFDRRVFFSHEDKCAEVRINYSYIAS